MLRSVAHVAVAVGLAIAVQGQWVRQVSPTGERLRGVSAASDTVAWAGGNKGAVLRTTDGGVTWSRLVVPDAAALDFRDVEAVDADTAHVLSIGAGDASRIYKTRDGGKTWSLQFRNADPRAFFDAIAFWDADHGLAAGDPVDGRFAVMRTFDGGRTWTPVPPANLPLALPGESAFAASGTCLVVQGSRRAWFGTGGGARSRVFRTADNGLTWSVADTPVAAGNASSGIFSLAFSDAEHGIAVGGDYRREGDGGDNLAITTDGGLTWTAPGVARLRAYRSAAAYLPGSNGRGVIAVGPAGSDVSADGGASWVPLGDEGFHALSVSPTGRLAWAVGEQGRIAVLRTAITQRGALSSESQLHRLSPFLP
jgi:photosystem II stability/assembly factor-like uncharacterized protein